MGLLAGGATAATSALPPTRNSQKVATAIASHSRVARWGSSIRVCCHCHPPLLTSLNPCSIQLRSPYQEAAPCCGKRSLKINHGSSCPTPHQPSNVPAICRLGVENAVPAPHQLLPCRGTIRLSGKKDLAPSGRKRPPALMRISGCQPTS